MPSFWNRQEEMNEKVAIYGWFEKGRCRYVGQTLHPRLRKYQHTRVESKHREIFLGCKFKIIEWTKQVDASAAEKRIIAEKRALGEADLNRTCGGAGCGATGSRVYWPAKDMWFDSINQAARYFKVSNALISQGAKHNGYFARTHGLIVEFPEGEIVEPYRRTDTDDFFEGK